jgi:SAM-dependent MidA family methyltransferase
MPHKTSAKTSTLPTPDLASQAHMEKVKIHLQNLILKQQRLSFCQFMQAVLYAPGLGYYCAGNQKFGVEGDFVTAPEISSLFGKCLALQCAEVLKEIEESSILEFGAGTGKLALDVMRQLEKLSCLPEHYYILEISAELKQRQQQFLKAQLPQLYDSFIWLERMPQNFNGIMLANEVLDAMPCHRFVIKNHKPYEYFVKLESDGFVWDLAPASKELDMAVKQLAIDLPNGYTSEINMFHRPWIKTLSDSLSRGMILLIDYGYPRSEYYHPQRSQGTLKCFFRHHQHEDPLIAVGIQDITAHVDFTGIAEAAVDCNLEIEGFINQGAFLLNCGIEKLLNFTANTMSDEVEQVNLIQQVKKLTLPTEMGELFKVMALSRKIDTTLCGFQTLDRLHQL